MAFFDGKADQSKAETTSLTENFLINLQLIILILELVPKKLGYYTRDASISIVSQLLRYHF